VRALSRRVDAGLSRRGFVAGAAGSVAGLGLAAYAGPARAQRVPARPVLIANARLFDGLSPNTRPGMSLLVGEERIADIAVGALSAPEGALVMTPAGGRRCPA